MLYHVCWDRVTPPAGWTRYYIRVPSFQLFILTGLTCDRTLLYNDCHYMADLGIAGVGRVGGIIVLVGTLLTCWLT